MRYSVDSGISENKNTTKRADELTESDFRELLDKVMYGLLDDATYIPMRVNTPSFFIDVVMEHSKGEIEVMNVPMVSQVGHLRQNMEEDDGTSYGDKRPHNLSVDDIVRISKEMSDPSYIILQKNGRYSMVVSFYNKSQKQVLVVIDFASDNNPVNNYKYKQYMNGYNEGYYNIIVTQFELDDLDTYLENNEVVYDKKKMNGKYQVGSGRIVAITHDIPFINNTISQPEKSVKKNSYADMVDLSADYDNAVEEYLRHKSRYNLNKVREIVNLAASKAMPDSVVRDESELLTKVYHGTEAESFNVFDKKRRGQTDSSLWGRGYYFTPDLEFATDFGENVRGFYLNITNPFIVTKVDAPASDIANRLKAMGIEVDFDYSKIKAFEFANHFGNQRFTDVLQEHGYDGVIVEDFEFVAFDQNQMKLADAITYDDNGDVIPLSERFDSGTNDIRYSRNDFSVDYSDLSVLDDEQIDAYNKRGWARGLFTSEDIALLNRRLGEIYHENSQYVRTTLADGTVVLDLNNKVLLVSGEFGDESILGVFSVSATSETYCEYIKD
ncbi:MAG: hypothetical protein IJ298_02760 [Ruminococcus sp.]|nr:hypothetical protein [Ruminococcus sp.]